MNHFSAMKKENIRERKRDRRQRGIIKYNGKTFSKISMKHNGNPENNLVLRPR